MATPKTTSTASLGAHLSLSQARCGERLKIVDLRKDSPAAVRLRELGFCESAEVCKVADHGACICVLLGTRVAIGPELASHVLVERVRP
jgi:ferrous iron transport protein A